MLHVPQLDDLDYQMLMNRARAMIPTLTDEWTDFNDHDPGITMLQVFAWLCDGLNYYINATGEQHRLKYLKLLGIEPKRSAAHCRIAISAPVGEVFSLPRGTRLAADGTIFELAEPCAGIANNMLSLYSGSPDKLLELTAFAGQDGEFATVFFADEQLYVLDIGFAGVLSDTVRMFVEIDNCGRTPFTDDFSLADCVWECSNGTEWLAVDVICDETAGLLRSGTITLQLPCATAPYTDEQHKTAHYLRCRLTRNDYDVAPRIGRVVLNCAEAIQVRSYTEAAVLVYDGSGILPLDCAVTPDTLLTVAVEDGDGYITYEGRYDVEIGAQPFLRNIRFDAERFGTAPKANDKILVITTEAEIVDELRLGTTDGCARQEFELLADNSLSLQLALVQETKDGTRRLTLWEQCPDLAQAGCDDSVFSYDTYNHIVRFGDGIHGLEPEAGQEVIAVTLKTSLLEAGNVLHGQLNTLVFPEISGMSISNLENAVGGMREQSSDELEVQIEHKLNTAMRAVTSQDICELVRATPGLLIDSVSVIPMKEYSNAYGIPYQANTLVVAVKPHSAQQLPMLKEVYSRRIREYLEEARLLTTAIKIVSAQYVGISIFGRITLTENNKQNQKTVADKIRSLADTVTDGKFGQGMDYGRLFSELELLGCVKSILQLSLEYIGAGGSKNEHGDIVVYPDSLSYLREIGIEFI